MMNSLKKIKAEAHSSRANVLKKLFEIHKFF